LNGTFALNGRIILQTSVFVKCFFEKNQIIFTALSSRKRRAGDGSIDNSFFMLPFFFYFDVWADAFPKKER